MEKLKAGLIATGFMPKDMDPFVTLEKFAAMGYKGFEVLMMAQGMDMATRKTKYTEEEALNKLHELGMEPLTAMMMAGPDGEYDVKAIAEQAHRLGVDRATCMGSNVAQYGFGFLDEPLKYDEAMKQVEQLERAAAALKKEGIKVAFHNHDEEFRQCYKGVPYFYLMAAYSDELKFELDTGWCNFGGFDPIQVMDQLGDRLCAVHIKDYQNETRLVERPKRTIVRPTFTTPGTGVLDLKGVLQKALDMGIDYAIIEQDFMYNLDPLATAQAGYYNMKETGLVE